MDTRPSRRKKNIRNVYDWQKPIKKHTRTHKHRRGASPSNTPQSQTCFALQMKISPTFVIDHRSVILGFCECATFFIVMYVCRNYIDFLRANIQSVCFFQAICQKKRWNENEQDIKKQSSTKHTVSFSVSRSLIFPVTAVSIFCANTEELGQSICIPFGLRFCFRLV